MRNPLSATEFVDCIKDFEHKIVENNYRMKVSSSFGFTEVARKAIYNYEMIKNTNHYGNYQMH